MLSCIVGSKTVNSFDYEEAKLREWSSKEILRCPECNERVIYCKGDYKIPYFKHEIGSECEGNRYYEPMTEEHIKGIKLIYNRLKEIDGIENLEVEKYIQNTKQRPDIYFEYKGKRYCIEYQCSPISTQYNKRHELYELEGINDIWILGTEKYNFDKFDESDNCINFSEKGIKTIEDEIDRGNAPLLYLSGENILKVDETGFIPILRDDYKYFYKNSPLKKTVGMFLDKYNINDVNINTLTIKNNLNINEILEEAKATIEKCEKIVREVKERHDLDILFTYNLLVDRFPLYLHNVGTSYYSKYASGNKISFNCEDVVEKLKKDVEEKLRKVELIRYLEDKNKWINLIDNKYNFGIDYQAFSDDIFIIKNGYILYKLNCKKLSNIEEFQSLIIDKIDKLNKTHEIFITIKRMIINRYDIGSEYIKYNYDLNMVNFSIYIYQKDEIIDFDIYWDEKGDNNFKIHKYNYYKIIFDGNYEYLNNLFNNEIADEIRSVRYGQV